MPNFIDTSGHFRPPQATLGHLRPQLTLLQHFQPEKDPRFRQDCQDFRRLTRAIPLPHTNPPPPTAHHPHHRTMKVTLLRKVLYFGTSIPTTSTLLYYSLSLYCAQSSPVLPIPPHPSPRPFPLPLLLPLLLPTTNPNHPVTNSTPYTLPQPSFSLSTSLPSYPLSQPHRRFILSRKSSCRFLSLFHPDTHTRSPWHRQDPYRSLAHRTSPTVPRPLAINIQNTR